MNERKLFLRFLIDEREVGTENKLVSMGSEDGFLRVIALKSRKTVKLVKSKYFFHFKPS
jgi:hypothetical protein